MAGDYLEFRETNWLEISVISCWNHCELSGLGTTNVAAVEVRRGWVDSARVHSIWFLSGSMTTAAFDLVHGHSVRLKKSFRNPRPCPLLFQPRRTGSAWWRRTWRAATQLRNSRNVLCLAAVVSTRRPHTSVRRVPKTPYAGCPWPSVLTSDAHPLSSFLALRLQDPQEVVVTAAL